MQLNKNYPPLSKMSINYSNIRFILYFGIFIFSCKTFAIEILTDTLDLDCTQSESFILACSYRPLINQQIREINAQIQGKDLGISTNLNYPTIDSVTAVLFLIDTSDPGRQNVIDKNAVHIEQMLRAVDQHHLLGFANFDKDLTVSVPMGRNSDQIITAARSLKASGLTTELYRNTIKAIEILSRANADRKVLFIFSDGQAEDKAYYHEDVVNVARIHGVVINSLGFPRSTPLSVALQTLRRLSEETGGMYIESDINYDLPTSFLSRPFANIDRGGHIVIDLNSSGDISSADPRVILEFDMAAGNIPVSVPVSLPVTVIQQSQQLPETSIVPSPPVVPQLVTSNQRPEPEYLELLLWYGLPIALVILIILTLLTLFLLSRRQKTEEHTSNVAYAKITPLAYLVTQDEKGKSYPVTSTTWRIGRSLDNEMTISDNSISRRHAEIQRESNGQFVVYDRDSTNGLYVNNKKVTRHLLNEGDIIEIGDIFLRFTQNPLDYQFADDTAVINTRAPEIF